MTLQARSPNKAHFGEFTLDLCTHELWNNGRKLKLQEQPFLILEALLERPGELVARDALKNLLWGKTFVDFEPGLNRAVSRLREALRDSAEQPRFIETLEKLGYRFIAEVTWVYPEQVPNRVPLITVQGANGNGIQQVQPEEPGNAPPRNVLWRQMIFAFIMLALLGLGLAVLRLKFAPRLSVTYAQLTFDGRNKGGNLLADGSRVYFSVQGLSTSTLAVAAKGIGVGFITLPLDVDKNQSLTLFDLSTSGSEVLAGRFEPDEKDGELWIVPLIGSSPRRVGSVRAENARWSPDGKRVAFIFGTDLYICASDGAGPHKIATLPSGAYWLRWSPDQKRFRFSTGEYRNGDTLSWIWEVNADGTSLHQLFLGWNNPPGECCGSWTPDGKYFIFQSVRGVHSDTWAVSETSALFGANSSPVMISSGLLDFSAPAISNDGKHVYATGEKRSGELVRYDRTLHKFTEFLSGVSANWVSFSKSGRSIAYIAYPDLTVWRAKADGSERVQITFAPLQADGLSWSPDEKRVAIRARNPGNPWKIYLVPSQGGEPQLLTLSDREQGIATWSADGVRLCFGDVPRRFGVPEGKEVIHIYDTRTHKLNDLPGSEGLWTSRWSPDGRYISALTIEGQKLKLFDFSTSTWRLTNAEHVNTPNWTSDGSYIYYDTEPRDRSLQRVRVADGEVEFLVSLRDFSNFPGWWSGLSPNNDPLLFRDLGSTEIYSLSLEYH